MLKEVACRVCERDVKSCMCEIFLPDTRTMSEGKKYPKKCPACNSQRISKDDKRGMLCDRCGYINRRSVKPLNV